MSLNLTSSNRNSNPYYVEIDKLRVDLDAELIVVDEIANEITLIDNRVTSLELGGGGGGGGGAVVADILNDINVLQADTATIQAVNATQNINISANATAITAIQSVNASQNIYINAINDDIITINESITNIDEEMTDIFGRVTSLEGETTGGAQYNNPFPKPDVSPWGASFASFIDFADSENEGNDATGLNRNATIVGGQWANDTTVVNGCPIGACHELFSLVSTAYPGSNQPRIEMSAHINTIKTASYTISCWCKPTTASDDNVVFSISDSTRPTGDPIDQTSINLIYSSVGFQLLAHNSSPTVAKYLDLRVPATVNQWHHVCVRVNSTGHQLYVDGVLATGPYTTGTSAVHLQLSGGDLRFNPDTLWFGARLAPISYPVSPIWIFDGRITDITISSNYLDATLIQAMARRDYGSDCVLLAGQSNMVGVQDNQTDLDYSKHRNRVIQFKTFNNINQSSPYNIIQAEYAVADKNLYHPQGSSLNNIAKAALWKSFADNYMDFHDLPSRRKLLLIPCARGSTGFDTDWQDGQPMFTIVVNACIAVFGGTNNAWNHLKALLWNQGEESIGEQDDLFKSRFNLMIAGFKTQIPRCPIDLPVVFAEVVGSNYDWAPTNLHDYKKIINRYYAELASENLTYRLVKTLGKLKCVVDNKHIDAEGMLKLGKMYYDALIDIVGNSRKPLQPYSVVTNYRTGVRDVCFPYGAMFKPTSLLGHTDLRLDTYTSYIHSAVTSGCNVGTLFNFEITRIGNLVNIRAMTNMTVATGAVNTLDFSAIPASFWPKIDIHTVCWGSADMSGFAESIMSIILDNATGEMSIGLIGAGRSFATGRNIQIRAFTFTYPL